MSKSIARIEVVTLISVTDVGQKSAYLTNSCLCLEIGYFWLKN